MMDDLSASFLFFGVLLLAANLSGMAVASRAFRDAMMFQAELREERARLRAENEKLGIEISKLKEQVLELRQQYNAALDQIAELNNRLASSS